MEICGNKLFIVIQLPKWDNCLFNFVGSEILTAVTEEFYLLGSKAM
jgi:hypothetical protein